jgi:hypothetical protein
VLPIEDIVKHPDYFGGKSKARDQQGSTQLRGLFIRPEYDGRKLKTRDEDANAKLVASRNWQSGLNMPVGNEMMGSLTRIGLRDLASALRMMEGKGMELPRERGLRILSSGPYTVVESDEPEMLKRVLAIRYW